MKNLFDFRRFGKYLMFDLHNFKNNYLFSLVMVGLIPIISYIFYLVGAFVFNDGVLDNFMPGRVMAFGLAFAITFMTAPIKLYGRLTEKKEGSNWLLIPASGLEKFLSMLVITCLVLPAGLIVLLQCSDLLMSLIAPQGYGKFILSYFDGSQLKIGDEISALSINWPVVSILNWCESILIFTLGAIFFKKGKVGKTILCSFAVGIVLGTVFTRIIPFDSCDWSNMSLIGFSDTLNVFSSISYAIMFILLLTGLYCRIRTLKH